MVGYVMIEAWTLTQTTGDEDINKNRLFVASRYYLADIDMCGTTRRLGLTTRCSTASNPTRTAVPTIRSDGQ
jgi:hypothetical protein